MPLYGHLLNMCIIFGPSEKQMPRQDYHRFIGKHTHEEKEEKAGEGKEDLQPMMKVCYEKETGARTMRWDEFQSMMGFQESFSQCDEEFS